MEEENEVSWKFTVMGIAIIFLMIAIGYWWLDRLLLDRAWAIVVDEQWKISATGWPLLLDLWPIALAGALLGIGIGYIVSAQIAIKTIQMDIEEKEKSLAEYRESVEGKEQYVLEEGRKIDYSRQEKLQELADKEQHFEARKRDAEAYYTTANKMVEEARLEVDNAERRRINATATAERRKRQIDKLNAKLAQY